MNRITGSKTSIEQMTGKLYSNTKTEVNKPVQKQNSFEQILLEKQQQTQSMQPLKFSKHASLRLTNREISMTKEQIERLQDGVGKAKAKGIQESLVMVDDLAFIVNTKSNTVITAVNEIGKSVFTNIDGAVIN